jgi:hypothetical protein
MERMIYKSLDIKLDEGRVEDTVNVITIPHAKTLSNNFMTGDYKSVKVTATYDWYKIELTDKKGKPAEILIYKNKVEGNNDSKELTNQIEKYEPMINIIQARMK